MNLSFSTFEIVDNVAVIKMNNPPVNAMTPTMLDEFTDIIDTLNFQSETELFELSQVYERLLHRSYSGRNLGWIGFHCEMP